MSLSHPLTTAIQLSCSNCHQYQSFLSCSCCSLYCLSRLCPIFFHFPLPIPPNSLLLTSTMTSTSSTLSGEIPTRNPIIIMQRILWPMDLSHDSSLFHLSHDKTHPAFSWIFKNTYTTFCCLSQILLSSFTYI